MILGIHRWLDDNEACKILFLIIGLCAPLGFLQYALEKSPAIGVAVILWVAFWAFSRVLYLGGKLKNKTGGEG